jgi:hypothetical protein
MLRVETLGPTELPAWTPLAIPATGSLRTAGVTPGRWTMLRFLVVQFYLPHSRRHRLKLAAEDEEYEPQSDQDDDGNGDDQ